MSEPAVRRQLVYNTGQNLRQLLGNLVLGETRPLSKRLDYVRTKGRTKLTRCDWLILARTDPRTGGITQTTFLELAQ
jgi:hypothetical protein